MNGVSLFSGAGVGELLLDKTNINIVVANELMEKRAEFYKEVFPECKMIQGDILDPDIFKKIVKISVEENCRFLIATPPCQGMSVAGNRDYDDPRNALILKVIEAIELINPDYVIIENVPKQLTTKVHYKGKHVEIENLIYEKFSGTYNINNKKIIDAENYSIPQRRRRAVFLLSKHGQWEFPEEKNKKITVYDSIGHLPSVEAIVREKEHLIKGNENKLRESEEYHKWHIPRTHPWRHVLAMKHTPTGETAHDNKNYYPKKKDGTRVKGYNTTYKRMEWDKPAPTITTANGAISSQCNVHPGRKLGDGTYSDARALTVYELMLLSTIPEDWKIPQWATDTLIREVIGESVPPLLIKKIVDNMPKKT